MKLRKDEFEKHQFFRRVVTLVYHYSTPGDPNKLTRNGGSAFVIEVKGECWLVTAAHIVHDLRKHASQNCLEQFIACDAWSGKDGTGRPIVLLREPSRWLSLGDGENFDLGAVELGPLITENLKAGKVLSVPESEWRNLPAKFDFYLLLGTPGELIEVNPPTGLPKALGPKRALAGIKRIGQPAYDDVKGHERFYGKFVQNKLPDGIKVKDIGGMSGGPIFGCKRTSKGLRSWVVAVQSGWYPDKKVMYGDFLPPLAALIEQTIQARKKQKTVEPPSRRRVPHLLPPPSSSPPRKRKNRPGA